MKTAIVIAAGGKGRRLGGAKPQALLGGRRLIDHALAFAERQGGPVAIAAPAPLPGITLPHIADPLPGLGPIGALAAAFRFATGNGCGHLLLIGCDQPFLPVDLLPRLDAAMAGAGAALPARGGQVEPLAGLWRVDPPALDVYLASGGRSLHGFAAAQGQVTVDWPDDGADPFANINTPADLAAANRRLTPER